MLFQRTLLILAATAVAAVPVSGAPAQSKLKSWEIQSLGTGNPSGYPGSPVFSTLDLTIVDPNTIVLGQGQFGPIEYPPSSAHCSLLFGEDVPWGKDIPCQSNSTYSIWSFKLIQSPGASPTENFTLAFTLIDGVADGSGTPKIQTYTGGDHFEVGKNLEGECGGSGVCSWGLKKSPYAIKQTQQKK